MDMEIEDEEGSTMDLWKVAREDLQKWKALSLYPASSLREVKLVCFPYPKSNVSSPDWALVVRADDKVFAVGDIPAWALDRVTIGNIEIAALSGKGVKDLAYGEGHCLALTGSSKVMSWGENHGGQLGLGSRESSKVPVELPALTKVTAVACGKSFSLVLTENVVYAWGSSKCGQCGSSEDNVLSPRKVDFPAGVKPTSITCGTVHAAALGSDGKVYCWGNNKWGQLGRGSVDEDRHNEPQAVQLPSAAKKVCCSGRSTLALLDDGQLWAWGNNVGKRLKVGSNDDKVKIPMQVTFLTGVTDITSFWGQAPFLARTESKQIFAWRHLDEKEANASSLAGVVKDKPTPTLIVED